MAECSYMCILGIVVGVLAAILIALLCYARYQGLWGAGSGFVVGDVDVTKARSKVKMDEDDAAVTTAHTAVTDHAGTVVGGAPRVTFNQNPPDTAGVVSSPEAGGGGGPAGAADAGSDGEFDVGRGLGALNYPPLSPPSGGTAGATPATPSQPARPMAAEESDDEGRGGDVHTPAQPPPRASPEHPAAGANAIQPPPVAGQLQLQPQPPLHPAASPHLDPAGSPIGYQPPHPSQVVVVGGPEGAPSPPPPQGSGPTILVQAPLAGVALGEVAGIGPNHVDILHDTGGGAFDTTAVHPRQVVLLQPSNRACDVRAIHDDLALASLGVAGRRGKVVDFEEGYLVVLFPDAVEPGPFRVLPGQVEMIPTPVAVDRARGGDVHMGVGSAAAAPPGSLATPRRQSVFVGSPPVGAYGGGGGRATSPPARRSKRWRDTEPQGATSRDIYLPGGSPLAYGGGGGIGGMGSGLIPSGAGGFPPPPAGRGRQQASPPSAHIYSPTSAASYSQPQPTHNGGDVMAFPPRASLSPPHDAHNVHPRRPDDVATREYYNVGLQSPHSIRIPGTRGMWPVPFSLASVPRGLSWFDGPREPSMRAIDGLSLRMTTPEQYEVTGTLAASPFRPAVKALPQGPEGDGDPAASTPSIINDPQQFRVLLSQFYMTHNPTGLGVVDDVVARCFGSEHSVAAARELLARMHQRYSTAYAHGALAWLERHVAGVLARDRGDTPFPPRLYVKNVSGVDGAHPLPLQNVQTDDLPVWGDRGFTLLSSRGRWVLSTSEGEILAFSTLPHNGRSPLETWLWSDRKKPVPEAFASTDPDTLGVARTEPDGNHARASRTAGQVVIPPPAQDTPLSLTYTIPMTVPPQHHPGRKARVDVIGAGGERQLQITVRDGVTGDRAGASKYRITLSADDYGYFVYFADGGGLGKVYLPANPAGLLGRLKHLAQKAGLVEDLENEWRLLTQVPRTFKDHRNPAPQDDDDAPPPLQLGNTVGDGGLKALPAYDDQLDAANATVTNGGAASALPSLSVAMNDTVFSATGRSARSGRSAASKKGKGAPAATAAADGTKGVGDGTVSDAAPLTRKRSKPVSIASSSSRRGDEKELTMSG